MEGGVKKRKLGKNEGRGAGLVAGMGEPGRVLLGADCGAAQERESRGGAVGGRLPGRCRNGKTGVVLPGAARWRAKK